MMALFLVFFQIGLFSVGGGYAAILLQSNPVLCAQSTLTQAIR